MAISIYLNGTAGAQDGTLEVTGDGIGAELTDIDSVATFFLRAEPNYKTSETLTVYAPLDCHVSSDGVNYDTTCTYAAGAIQDVNVPCYIKRVAMTQLPANPRVETTLHTYPHCAYVAVNDTSAPTLTGPLTATIGAYQVALDWNDATDNNAVTGYDIEYGTSLSYGTATTSVVSNATITGLTAGTLYYFRVRAYDGSGNKSGWITTSATPVIFIDDFNRADSLTVGNGWSQNVLGTPAPTSYGVKSNALYIEAAGNQQADIHLGRATTLSAARKVQLKIGATQSYIYLDRSVNGGVVGNSYYVGNGYVLIPNPTSGLFLLRRMDNGVTTNLANPTVAHSPGDILAIAREGNDIVTYKNGTEVSRVTDTTYMSNLGYLGVAITTGTTVGASNSIDDFTVTA